MIENPTETALSLLAAGAFTNGNIRSFKDHTVRYVNLKNVISTLWNQGRFDYWYSRSEETRPWIHYEPIVVSKIILNDKKHFYLITDGNHRTEVLKRLGVRHIKAEISGETRIYTKNFTIYGNRLWVRDPEDPGIWILVNEIGSIETLRALHLMGVEIHD